MYPWVLFLKPTDAQTIASVMTEDERNPETIEFNQELVRICFAFCKRKVRSFLLYNRACACIEDPRNKLVSLILGFL